MWTGKINVQFGLGWLCFYESKQQMTNAWSAIKMEVRWKFPINLVVKGARGTVLNVDI